MDPVNEPKDPVDPKEPEPTDPEPKEPEPQDPKPAEPTDPKEPELKDKHGQAAISAEKYDRDMKKKDEAITALQDKLGELSKTAEGREQLEKDISKLRDEIADEKVAHKLELLGCKNVKAAKALLEDHDNDPEKLKEAEPYLFNSEKKTGSTGFKPAGTAGGDIDSKLDKAFGL